MKALKCELCGSNDFVKNDEFFVCQYCKTKYTPEAARKMMIEGTVQVEGTVSVRGMAQAEGIFKNADMAFKDGNYAQAYDLYTQVLNIDPANHYALLLKGLSSAYAYPADSNRFNEAFNCMERVVMLVFEQAVDYGVFLTVCVTAKRHTESLKSTASQAFAQRKSDEVAAALDKKAVKDTRTASVAGSNKGLIASIAASAAYKAASEEYEVAAQKADAAFKGRMADVTVRGDKVGRLIDDLINKRAARSREAAAGHYKEHPELLASLKKEHGSLEAQASAKQQEIQQCRNYFQSKLGQMRAHRKGLGLFDFAAKKAADADIASTTASQTQVLGGLSGELDSLNRQLWRIAQKMEYGTDSVCDAAIDTKPVSLGASTKH
jgi:tetratricopeptide (TPR) repeat protein